MNKQTLLLLILSFIIFGAESQQLFHEYYDWGEPMTMPADTAEQDMIQLFRKIAIEFHLEDPYFSEYDLLHDVKFINSDEAVEANNNIYLYYNRRAEIIDAKARLIKPSGKVIDFDNSKMLDSYDEETGDQFKYFAMEGLEKGDIIEVIHVVHRAPDYQGRRWIFQYDFPINRLEFDLFAPDNLIFEFLVSNDTNSVVTDTLAENNHWHFYIDNIEALDDEESAPYNTIRKQIVYKLDRNIANNLRDITSYGKASQIVFSNNYTSIEKADLKAVEKFLKEINVDRSSSLDEQIFKVENYVKNNINIIEMETEESTKLASVIKNKTASEDGITSLLVNLFKALGINHEIVLTSNRDDILFDKDFEAYVFLSDYLIYFPDTKKYLSPNQFENRYGLPASENTNNYGLFIKRVTLGDMESGLGKVKFIEPIGYEATHHNHYVTTDFSDDFNTVHVDMTTSSLGYFAAPLQPYIYRLSDELKEEIAEKSAENYIPNSELNSWEYINTEPEVIGKEPFLTRLDITSSDLVDVAGDKYLFKAGLLIGPQQELYSEKTRRLPVYDNYKRMFDRELTINIPEGYKVVNAGDLDIFAEYVVEGAQVLLFESKHTYEGGVIKVNIHEYYDQIEYTVEEYPYYRDVVNSASDFNKVVLILERK
ncbi:MAG TPA: DUF3857 domain-containing protein [Bacteroidales bacterium]|nr:DUF3857 domain-containing protein [Bacteroidales bacterium]HRX97152.1 DUF3857 domain-containing protein [Bacteroidales bacterium]